MDFNNESYSNYSKDSGKIIKNLKNNKVSIKKINMKNCINCNSDIKTDYTYCKFCGTNLEEAYIKCNNAFNNQFDFKNILNYLNLKDGFSVSIGAILILLAVSFGIKVLMNVYSSTLSSAINPIHVLLALNLGKLKIYSSSMIGWASTKINLGLIAFMILPLISIIISNLLFSKNKCENSKDVLRKSLSVGVSYGLILLVLSLFSKTSLSYSYNYMNYGDMAHFSFNGLNMMIKGFIIGFLPTFYLLYKKEYRDESLYLDIFKRAINMLLVGYLVTLGILIILVIVDRSFLDGLGVSQYTNSFGNIITLSQLAIYIWSFGNFIPVRLGEWNLSIFNIFSSSGYLTTSLVLIAMLFLSLLIIIIFACNLESKYKDKYGIKPIVILSVSYALLMGLISILTNLIFTDLISSYSSYVNMGMGLISSILISFIYSFLVSLVGYKLNVFN